LQGSFAAVAPSAELLADTFYRNLWADYPAVAPLFAQVDMPEQKKKLVTSLKLVVDNLTRPEVVGPVLEQLGGRHLEYGAEPDHYPAVGATLLKSLAEVGRGLWRDQRTDAGRRCGICLSCF
jgi:hemoglobin-like flavoprotein